MEDAGYGLGLLAFAVGGVALIVNWWPLALVLVIIAFGLCWLFG